MGFTIPSLPSGIRSLVDTSPSVFYPPTAAVKRERQRSQSFSDPNPPVKPRQAQSPRPTHRRAQSALPGVSLYAAGFNTTSPLEAVSELPTLHRRLGSAMSLPALAQSSSQTPLNDSDEESAWSTGGSSLEDAVAKFSRLGLSNCTSSVPPPQRTTQHATLPVTHATSAPRPVRPATSPRAMSTQNARPRPCQPSRRGSMASSSSSVSDLNVLATWSFPETNETSRGRPVQREAGSDSLKQRLRTLSALDTTSLPSSSLPAHLAPTNSRPSTPPSLPANLRSKTSMHVRTYSSPTPYKSNDGSMPPPPLPLHMAQRKGPMLPPPPPRPARRPTTSRLRQPQQLVMPQTRPSLSSRTSSQSLNLLLSSSYGSTLSDRSCTASPTSSVISLPGNTEAQAIKERDAWWGAGTPWKGPSAWRRRSVDVCSLDSSNTEPDLSDRMRQMADADLVNELLGAEDDDDDMFLTMDDA